MMLTCSTNGQAMKTTATRVATAKRTGPVVPLHRRALSLVFGYTPPLRNGDVGKSHVPLFQSLEQRDTVPVSKFLAEHGFPRRELKECVSNMTTRDSTRSPLYMAPSRG